MIDSPDPQPPVARNTIPSAEEGGRLIVIKVLPQLRLTGQFRRLLLKARKEEKKVELRLPENCELAGDLLAFLEKYKDEFDIVRIEPVAFHSSQEGDQ